MSLTHVTFTTVYCCNCSISLEVITVNFSLYSIEPWNSIGGLYPTEKTLVDTGLVLSELQASLGVLGHVPVDMGA